ncbi:MAG TPA: hypothetical protein DCE41_25260 [Cytophagales bacterium]|nr:hypothetical protein [Cytophagales bacterium]HAA24209.1 hypothetical protein [Cytophagales bacterium]HAP64386.1 hypothetical protein [Cytophagales bacterium]
MHNKRIVILGGTDGIGRALASTLVAENEVLIVGRSAHKGDSFVKQHGEQATFLSADLSLLNGLPPLVQKIKSVFPSVDGIVHAADLLRVQRLNTAEGLEISIATNYYSRVLFNQLMIGEGPQYRPERIIHVAAAGFPTSKTFMENFPLPEGASSFKGHGLGQISNDVYGLGMQQKLAGMGTKINILNPGTVDTDIRRKGQFPKIVKVLSPFIGLLLAGRIRSPESYAEIPLRILNRNNPEAESHTLINSRGKGISGNSRVNDVDMQKALYEHTQLEVNRVLRDVEITSWL